MNSPQYKNSGIANIILALLLEMNEGKWRLQL